MRRSINTLRDDLNATISQAGNYYLDRQPADMGNYSGTVEVPGTQNMVYVRLTNGQVLEVFNDVAPNIYNWKVYIGRDKSQPQLVKVLEVRWVHNIIQTAAYVLFHHGQHEYPNPDTVWIRRDQFMPLLVLPAGGFTVRLFGDLIPTNPAIRVEDADIDLTSYSVALGAKYVLMEAWTDGTIHYKESALSQSRAALHFESYPVPTEGAIPIAVLEFFAGQTELRRDSTERSIIDMRSFTTEWLTSTGTQIAQADEVDSIDDEDYVGFYESADGALKKIEFRKFQLSFRQYAEQLYAVILKRLTGYIASGSAAGGDLSGTYPNPTVAKVNGKTYDYTGLADTNVMMYDTATGKFLPGAGVGYVLTVEEVDTAPQVVGVTKIVVPNGSLTDNGSGEVALDFATGAGGLPLTYDDLSAQIPAASDHYDLAGEATDGIVLLFYNTTMQSMDTFTMDGDNLGLTLSFSPVAGDKLIAVYGLNSTAPGGGVGSPALNVYLATNFT